MQEKISNEEQMTKSGLDPVETAITDEFVLYHNGSDLSRQILLID